MDPYDLQKDYVDSLSDVQKLDLFKALSPEVQSIAEEYCGVLEECSDQTLIDWISASYAYSVTIPYYNCSIYCYDEFEYDELVNNHWMEKFENYEPYDEGHQVVVQLEKHVDVTQVVRNEEYDALSADPRSNIVRFLCPSYWIDVPAIALLVPIVENCSFNWLDIKAFYIEDV